MQDHDLQPPASELLPTAQEALGAMQLVAVSQGESLSEGEKHSDFEGLDAAAAAHAAEALAADVAAGVASELVSEPNTEQGAEPASVQTSEPIPDLSTLTAAQEAAAFVAQIFADPSISDTGSADVTAVEMTADSEAAAVQELPPVPVHWPQGAGHVLQGQRVLILGLGISGLAMARWCVRAGADVTVADTRSAPPSLAAMQAELPGVRFVAGEFSAALVDGQNLSSVYRSPGLSPASVAPVFNAARSIGLPVGGELDLFAQALAALRHSHGYAPKVLGVTGTNGKTTVTTLTGLLLESAGLNVAVAGNIGPTLLDTLSQHIDAQTLPQAWVLELSSFQLDDCQVFEPTAATVLNISQDHLDWHGGMKAYAAAKARVFGEQGLMVLNREDPAVMAMLPAPVPVPGKRGKTFQRAHLSFGGDMPRAPGDFGLEVVNGMTWLVRAHEADETSKGKHADDLHIVRLMPADALRIRGRHNAINALAALALATGAGCQLAPLLYALREYRGEPHRVQPVGRVNDVEYFDDSKGTNVGATAAALTGLGADHRIVVILGGLGKGQDFSPLAAPVSRYVRAAVLIGQDAPLIREALADSGVRMVDAASMEDAVQQASRLAHANDAVLLSPACASMDMFKDYAERAHFFVQAVRDLALEAGQELEEGA